MNPKIKSYFDNLTSGKVISLDKAKDPEAFKQSVFDYIDMYGHSIGFINDYKAIVKYRSIPTNGKINYFYQY